MPSLPICQGVVGAIQVNADPSAWSGTDYADMIRSSGDAE